VSLHEVLGDHPVRDPVCVNVHLARIDW
jgi:hypothetical protein